MIKVPKEWVDKIRFVMRDYAELNELIEGEENSNQMIADAIVDAADDFNSITPNGTGLDINLQQLYTVNRTIRRMIIKLAIAILLENITLYMQRNEITTPSGNVQENLNDKWRSYDASIKRIKYGDTGVEGVIPVIKKYKTAVNDMSITQSIHSEMYYPYLGDNYYYNVMY